MNVGETEPNIWISPGTDSGLNEGGYRGNVPSSVRNQLQSPSGNRQKKKNSETTQNPIFFLKFRWHREEIIHVLSKFAGFNRVPQKCGDKPRGGWSCRERPLDGALLTKPASTRKLHRTKDDTSRTFPSRTATFTGPPSWPPAGRGPSALRHHLNGLLCHRRLSVLRVWTHNRGGGVDSFGSFQPTSTQLF